MGSLLFCFQGKPQGLSIAELSHQAQIYLSERGQFITLSAVNRGDITLGLFDQIVFFNKTEKENPFALEPLENFKTEKDIKMKVFSSCSHTAIEGDRISEERASRAYHSSFFIVNLLPKNILFHGLDQPFYCSFIISFKNGKGWLKHYNIAQQKIEPLLSRNIQANKLSLVRENDSGYYSPVEGIIKRKHINKVLLLNNTGKPVEKYHLFCEGLKVMTVPDFKVNIAPVFLNLMNFQTSWPEGVKDCRFFSENNKRITGITNSFQLDFLGLNKKAKTIDLGKIEAPVFAEIFGKEYSPGHKIPLNSYVYFKNFSKIIKSGEDYSSIELIADTQCVDNNPELNLFGKGNVVSKQIRFPLRAKFPVMSLTPEELFAMGPSYDQWLIWRNESKERFNQPIQFICDGKVKNFHTFPIGLSKCDRDFAGEMMERDILYHRMEERKRAEMNHYVSCIYKIKLKDKYRSDNNREFKDMYYTLQWDRAGYGMEYTALKEGG